MQVKLYDVTEDYLTYVWYSNERDPRGERVSNIVGTFQLNKSVPLYMQDGFHMASTDFTMYIVFIRNASVARDEQLRKSYVGLMLSLIDPTK